MDDQHSVPDDSVPDESVPDESVPFEAMYEAILDGEGQSLRDLTADDLRLLLS